MKFNILVLISFFSLISCSSDDSSNVIESQNLIGLWKIIDYNDSVFDNLADVEENDEPCFSLKTKKFNADFSLNDNYKYGNNCQNSGSIAKIYSIEGNILTETEINGGLQPNRDYIVKYEIQELTSTILKLKGIYVDEGVFETGTDISDDPFYETWQLIE